MVAALLEMVVMAGVAVPVVVVVLPVTVKMEGCRPRRRIQQAEMAEHQMAAMAGQIVILEPVAGPAAVAAAVALMPRVVAGGLMAVAAAAE